MDGERRRHTHLATKCWFAKTLESKSDNVKATLVEEGTRKSQTHVRQGRKGMDASYISQSRGSQYLNAYLDFTVNSYQSQFDDLCKQCSSPRQARFGRRATRDGWERHESKGPERQCSRAWQWRLSMVLIDEKECSLGRRGRSPTTRMYEQGR